MIRDHRPYQVKKAYRKLEDFYVRRFIKPQLAGLGEGYSFVRPWNIELFGWPIDIGKCANIISSPDGKVRLSIWSMEEGQGRISIGDFCLICPGVRIGASKEIVIRDNVMLATGAYIMDSDWHDLYNRISPSKDSRPVYIEENAWIGDSAIVCKGVTVGRNSIVGAGAVVVSDVPPNSIAAGNPARVVKRLDPDRPITTRRDLYQNHEQLYRDIDRLDRQNLKGNTYRHWIRHLLFPAKGE